MITVKDSSTKNGEIKFSYEGEKCDDKDNKFTLQTKMVCDYSIGNASQLKLLPQYVSFKILNFLSTIFLNILAKVLQ